MDQGSAVLILKDRKSLIKYFFFSRLLVFYVQRLVQNVIVVGIGFIG
jgi:hypothetical protein